MKEIDFYKMEGLGNDYVYLLRMDGVLPDDLPKLAVDISNRHFGIGGDGLVIITKSVTADFRMIMFNSDGSEAQMCGNASRCTARLVYEKGLVMTPVFTLETRAGIRKLEIHLKDDAVAGVSVAMGKPVLDTSKIPVIPVSGYAGSKVAVHSLEVGGRQLEVHCVGIGNPHGVIFMDVDEEFFQNHAQELEYHPIWPEKANIEFVRVTGPDELEMRVWERGAGETLACGTGACAAAAASILTGRTSPEVNVKMKGGSLRVRLDQDGEIIMTGDAQLVAHGIYFWDN